MEPESVTHRFDDIRWLERTGSTNVDVLEAGRQGAAEGVVIVADTQTAGRGRHGRTWVAPPGSGLLFSVLLRPRAAVADLVTPMAALAVQDAVVSLGAEGVGIKWPNDLVVAPGDGDGDGAPAAVDRKLVGILAEADWTTGSSTADGYRPPRADERLLVALGIGLNLTSSDDFPEEVLARRVALEDLTGTVPGRSDVLDTVLTALDGWFARLTADRDAVLEAWRGRCVTLGRRVRVDLGARDLVGTATDVDASGRLVVHTDDGDAHTVAAGDVVHLRDASA